MERINKVSTEQRVFDSLKDLATIEQPTVVTFKSQAKWEREQFLRGIASKAAAILEIPEDELEASIPEECKN